MGMSYNTGTANAIIAGTITSTEQKNTVKFLTSVVYNAGGSATLGTVPTGKVWRIVGGYVSSTSGGSGANSGVLQLASTTFLEARCQGTPVATTATLNLSYNTAIVATAGQAITLLNTNQGTSAGGIYYVEEDA